MIIGGWEGHGGRKYQTGRCRLLYVAGRSDGSADGGCKVLSKRSPGEPVSDTADRKSDTGATRYDTGSAAEPDANAAAEYDTGSAAEPDASAAAEYDTGGAVSAVVSTTDPFRRTTDASCQIRTPAVFA